MKFINFSLGLSTASLPYIEWSLRNTLEHFSDGIAEDVKNELANLADELKKTHERVNSGL